MDILLAASSLLNRLWTNWTCIFKTVGLCHLYSISSTCIPYSLYGLDANESIFDKIGKLSADHFIHQSFNCMVLCLITNCLPLAMECSICSHLQFCQFKVGRLDFISSLFIVSSQVESCKHIIKDILLGITQWRLYVGLGLIVIRG